MSRVVKYILLFLVTLAMTSPVMANGDIEVTPFIGYQFGGELTDYWTGDRYKLKGNENFGVSLDISVDPHDDTWIELRWSHQESELNTTIPELGRMGVDIDYFHIGGLQVIGDDYDNVIPYGVGTLGVTHFNPEVGGLSSDTRFSLGLGGGVKLMAGERIGIRLEARLLGTYFDSHSAMICGPQGGCSFGISGNMLFQGEVTIGLILAPKK